MNFKVNENQFFFAASALAENWWAFLVKFTVNRCTVSKRIGMQSLVQQEHF